jgi:small-conductance mechanosensitive channel
MADKERLIMDRLDRLEAQFSKESWRRDARIDVINRRIASIGNWLIGSAYLVVGLGAGYALKHSTDTLESAGSIGLAFLLWGGLYGTAKNFFNDPLAEQDLRELNAQRVADGLDPIRDPTLLETIGAFILVYSVSGLFLAIVGGIGAIVVDLLFLSRSFGQIAQLGLAASLAGFLGLVLFFSVSDWLTNWKAKRKAARDARHRARAD